MTAALRLLARRAASEAMLRAGLERRGFAKREVARVLGRLRELGYIDDRKLAGDWSERLQERGYGSLRIRERLRASGIEDGLAEGVVPGPREERSTARRVIRERFGDDPRSDVRGRGKAWRFLVSRGFPDEVVESVLGVWEE